MEEKYGVIHTRNLIYSVLNDEIGSLTFRLKDAVQDAEDYLKCKSLKINNFVYTIFFND